MTVMEEIICKIKEAKKIAILTHSTPDGDAFGSALGLKWALKELNKECDVFAEGIFPENIAFLPGVNEINPSFGKYDLMIVTDCASVERIGLLQTKVSTFANTIQIDHHNGNTKFAKLNYVPECSSAAEAVFNVISELRVKISKKTAICLASGIITDTGRFKFSCATPETFCKFSSILSQGKVELTEIINPIFESMSQTKFEVNRYCMDHFEFFDNNSIAILAMKEEDFKKLNANYTFTKDVSPLVLDLKSVKACAIIAEDKGEYHISYRSKGTVNVSKAAQTFGGGGHINASGCKTRGNMEDVKIKVLKTIRNVM